MAFTKDSGMADWLREQRHQDIRRNSTVAELRQISRVWLRTLAHASWLYKLSRRAAESRTSVSASNTNRQSADRECLTPEWWQAPTAFHLTLAHDNLKQSESFTDDRIEYNRISRAELDHLTHDVAPGKQGWLTLPPDNPDAMSHFCLRVHPSLRDSLRQYLWLRGIDTAVLFPFPEGADSNQLRNTYDLTRQIIGLPLSNGLGSHNIRHICSLIADFIRTQQAGSNQPSVPRSAA